VRPQLRSLAETVSALYWRLRTRGGIRGRAFILRSGAQVRVRGGGSIAIGVGASIEPAARLVAQAPLVIGDGVYVGKNATLVAFAPLRIGSRTLLGENVSIHTENHGPLGRRAEFTSAAISIGEDVWLGAGVVVTSGVTIGDGATIGANAVVVKDVPPGAVAVGVPARVIRGS